MRAPTRPTELLLAILALSAFGLWRAGVHSVAAKEAELELVRSEREAVQRENDALRAARDQVDRAAADSIATLEAAIADAELRASEAASQGRETYVQIIEAVPDSMPELRSLVERRERMHETEVAVLNIVIDAERNAADVLRGQITERDALISGLEAELVIASEQIALLEDLRHDGFSTLESAALGAGGYVIATEALGASTLEGLIAGGTTFLVTQGGSKLIDWIF